MSVKGYISENILNYLNGNNFDIILKIIKRKLLKCFSQIMPKTDWLNWLNNTDFFNHILNFLIKLNVIYFSKRTLVYVNHK